MNEKSKGSLEVICSPDNGRRPSREEAEAAVHTLIRWTGDDPEREGLVETPKRVVKAFEELYGGYRADIGALLSRTFSETDNYDEFVLVRDISFVSHCEHHMLPFKGVAHIAYYPNQQVVGLSKLVRLTELFARRLQTQEKMTSQICEAIERYLTPRGVAVLISAEHSCISMRGIRSKGSRTCTSRFRGLFADMSRKEQFLNFINNQ